MRMQISASGELSGPAQAIAPGCPVPAPPQANHPRIPADRHTLHSARGVRVLPFLHFCSCCISLKCLSPASLEIHETCMVLATPCPWREWKTAGPDGPADASPGSSRRAGPSACQPTCRGSRTPRGRAVSGAAAHRCFISRSLFLPL